MYSTITKMGGGFLGLGRLEGVVRYAVHSRKALKTQKVSFNFQLPSHN